MMALGVTLSNDRILTAFYGGGIYSSTDNLYHVPFLKKIHTPPKNYMAKAATILQNLGSTSPCVCIDFSTPDSVKLGVIDNHEATITGQALPGGTPLFFFQAFLFLFFGTHPGEVAVWFQYVPCLQVTYIINL